MSIDIKYIVDGAGLTSLLHITMNMNSAWVCMTILSVLECFHTPGNGSRNQAECSACNGSSDLPVRNLIVFSSVNTTVIALKTYLARHGIFQVLDFGSEVSVNFLRWYDQMQKH